jgi:hypothetical protein
MSSVIRYTVQDLLELNKKLNYPKNFKLISNEFKTIPGCNKSYGFKKNEKENNIDNIRSILNKIHTSTFDKLYHKIYVIIKNDNSQIDMLFNIIEEYLCKSSMLNNSLECYAKIIKNLYNNNLIIKQMIINFVNKIYYKQCYNKYNITTDISEMSSELNSLLSKLNIVPKDNKITCDNIVDISSNLNIIMNINIKIISYIQENIFKNDLDILYIIINSFINNSTINNYNLISLNSILINNTLSLYIKENYNDKIYDIYDNLDSYINNNDYDSKMCESEIEKIIYKLCKAKSV